MHKWWALLLAGMLLMFHAAVALCDNQAPAPTPSSNTQQTNKGNQQIVIRLAYDDQAQTVALQQIADAYGKTHSAVRIELMPISKVSYYTRLESMAMGSVLPDVFVIHPERVMDFVSAGALMDLSLAGIDFSPFPEAVTALYRYNNIPYAVPKDVDGVALAYNKALFKQSDVELPKATWTWADLRRAALDITDIEKNIWGFAAPNDGATGYYQLIYQNGGYVFRDNRSGFGDPLTQEAVRFWVDLALVDHVSPLPEDYPDVAPSEWFTTGQVAMQFVRGSQIAKWRETGNIQGMFDVMTLPMQTQRAAVCEGAAFAAAANTKNADAVRAFMAYLATRPAAELYAGATSAFPANQAVREAHTKLYPDVYMQAFLDSLADAVPMPISPMRVVWEPLEYQAMEDVYDRKATVEAALTALHEEITMLEGTNIVIIENN